MTDLHKHITSLNKSTANIVKATNAAQRSAARSFLIKRGQELHAATQEVEAWLQEADQYITKEEPEINAVADHEYNVQWIERLREYEQAQTALDSAWSAYMETLEDKAA